MRFVDTNVPSYAVSALPEDAPKLRAAEHLLSQPDLAFSVQVFGEFYVQVTRPSRPERSSMTRRWRLSTSSSNNMSNP